MGDLSKHFSRSEFACRGGSCCGRRVVVRGDLIDALEALRGIAGGPLIVTSGFRCGTHNASVGGAPNSYHTRGMAADIQCRGVSPDRLAEMAETVPAFRDGGIGVYSSWIHVDVRGTGRARW